MKTIENSERQRLGALLDHASQEEVMAEIPQFAVVETGGPQDPKSMQKAGTDPWKDGFGVLVFNMERGVHLEELGDFLETCPDVKPFDIILANELDEGCVRSGGKNTTEELAKRLGMQYAYGLEFIELVNGEDPKGFHGNAVFSRWPITRARVVRLPEQYNWYFDRQRRIGGRLAVLAEVDVNGRSLGVGTIHLENRTDGPGREAQLRTVLQAADAYFGDLPVILGGDLNTNTFDGRDKDAINEIAGSKELQRRCLEDVEAWEGALPAARSFGYGLMPEKAVLTRRKPLPGGGHLDLRLDWLLLRGVKATDSRTISTARKDCGFALPGSALEKFAGEELSDHNAVWALCKE